MGDETYDDKHKKSTNIVPMRPEYKLWTGKSKFISASVSPLMAWYLEEQKKREKGLMNEIDINEIKAALKGVKNKWYEKAKHDTKKFQNINTLSNIEWRELTKWNSI